MHSVKGKEGRWRAMLERDWKFSGGKGIREKKIDRKMH